LVFEILNFGNRHSKMAEHPLCQGKAENDLAKRLANPRRRANMKKEARAVRGQEIKWEIP
jgi:hypothetical protein